MGEQMDATDIVYISAEVTVGLITVIGNCLVLAAIVKTRRLHTITNVFVGNLAIADIAVGVLVAPCAALSFKGLPSNFYGCVFINCLILMFTNISILMLLSVAIERFIAIKEPFLYHRLLTVRRAVLINVCVWVLGSVLGLMPMYGWHGEYRSTSGYCKFTEMITYEYMVYFQFFGLVLIPLFFMLCIYIYILIIVRRHMRQTSALLNRFQQDNPSTDGFNKDVRAAKMFALVILMFAIFWFPVNIFNCVSLFCGADCYFPKQALLAAIVMSHANSSINPFLYATSNSRIKGAIKGLCGIKLNADERSSTDQNNARHITHGTSRVRENVATLKSHRHNSSSNKDDAQSNSVSHEELQQGISQPSAAPEDQPKEGDNGKLPNNTQETVNNNDLKQSFNTNNRIPNSSPTLSNVSICSLAATDLFTEGHSSSPRQLPHRRSHLYSQTNDINHPDFVYSSTTSSLLPESHSYCHKKIQNDHCCTGHPNLAFVDAESFSTAKEESSHVTTFDKIDGNKIKIHSNNHHLKNSGFQDHRDNGDHEIIEPFIIYRQFSTGPYNSYRLNKLPESNASVPTNELLVVRMFTNSVSPETTISSLSGHGIDSIEKLELRVNSQEDTRTDCCVHNDKHTGHEAKTNNVFTSSIFVEDYTVQRNAKTEQTKF